MKPLAYIPTGLMIAFSAIISANASPVTHYQTPLEQAQWHFSGDVFGCKITHEVEGFGAFQLQAMPGEKLTLTLKANWLSQNKAKSVAQIVAPSWQPHHSLAAAKTSLHWQGAYASSNEQVAPFLEALEQGLSWQVNIASRGGSQYQVDASAVATKQVANAFKQCRQALLPKPLTYVRRVDIQFAPSVSKISLADEADLNAIVKYVHADPRVKEILVDGHSDTSGEHLANLVLSKERADEIASRLIELGANPNMVQVRHHGTRSPIADNTSRGRAANRRVTIRLVTTAEARKGTKL